jgi:hypothetical protein
MGSYNMSSGRLFTNMAKAPWFFLKGKITLSPHKIRQIERLERVFPRVEEGEELRASPPGPLSTCGEGDGGEATAGEQEKRVDHRFPIAVNRSQPGRGTQRREEGQPQIPRIPQMKRGERDSG